MSEGNDEEDLQAQDKESGSSEGVSKNSEKVNSKDIKNLVNNFTKNKAGARTLVKAISKILVTFGWVIIALIIIIGIIMFLLTMPGMVMEKIKGLFKAAANAWNSWWGDDSATQFENVQIYEILNYLDDMGYDLKGYGFITKFLTQTADTTSKTDIDGYDNGGEDIARVAEDERKLTEDGVIRDSENTVVTGVSEFINTYLISENYIYTIKNFNVVDESGWDAFWNHVKAGLLGTTSALNKRKGMLIFYHDTGTVGSRGGAYAAAERGYIKFDPNSRQLLIKRGWTNSAMSYNLDGWTGRYGMPVDFLLTVHLATQMPDLAYDMATHFETEVNILLHESSGTEYGAYKIGENDYVTYVQVTEALGETSSTGFIGAIDHFFDDLNWTNGEMDNLHKLGIIPPGGCDCEKTEAGVATTRSPIDNNIITLQKDKDGYYYEIEVYGEGPQKIRVSEDKVSLGEELKKVGDNCLKYIKFVVGKMKKESDDSYKTYTPYIESVQSHWFRDVYFVGKSINDKGEKIAGFVDYDYQYELLTGERWTLYETYTSNPNDGDLCNPEKEGEFVYYILEDDGTIGDRYDGIVTSEKKLVEKKKGDGSFDGTLIERQASRGENGEAVVKKAKTIDLSEKYKDLGWDKNWLGTYIAYDPKIQDSTPNYDQMYTTEEINNEDRDDLEKDAMSKMYIEVKITDVTQTGEGLRTETNSDIKKMFLINNYFRYDGSRQRAEIIYALREKLKSNYSYSGYGPIDKNIIKNYDNNPPKLSFNDDKYTAKPKDDTYKLSDYVGNVSIQQDALNTFTMLENSHTVDSDYIYKDFKELVVELGYFEKEELTESKPKLLQWVVPDTGSGGYPDRTIDKREEEYGTLVHSKMDIDANKVATIVWKIREAASEENQAKSAADKPTGVHFEASGGTPSGREEVFGINFSEVGAISESAGAIKKPEEVSVEEFLAAAEEVHKVIEDLKFEYCWGVGQTHTSDWGHVCSGLFNTLEDACGTGGHRIDCSTYVSYVLQAVGLMTGRTYTGSPEGSDGFYGMFSEYIITREEAGELQPGDMLLSDSHIQINGENHLQYNAGSGDKIRSRPYEESSPSFYTHVIRLPFGGSKSEGAPYEGYLGNEAVVSPVTGVLMEYGTYNEEEADENRQNIDIKYGKLLENKKLKKVTVKDPDTGEETTEIKYPSDKVGYAVIKILDAETYKKLESKVTNKWNPTNPDDSTKPNENASLVKINEKSKDYDAVNKHVAFKEKTDELTAENRNWTNMEETVYGYKEFAEQYERFGIGGYYIYIDGFKCETVDEELASKDESDDSDDTDSKKEIPQGDKLTLDSFKISEDNVNDDNFEPDIQSLYEPDEVSKLMSKDETEKLKAESMIKSDASLGITFNFDDIVMDEDGKPKSEPESNEYILIKEGTVIGRTLTDYELLHGEDFRNIKDENDETFGTYDQYVEAQKKFLEEKDKQTKPAKPTKPESQDEEEDLVTNKVPLIGNYLRIIMQEKDGDIVENVEDYMKLDDAQKADTLGDIEQFMYWQAKEPEGFEFIINGQQSYSYGKSKGKSRRDNSSDKYGHDYAVDDGGAGDRNLCPGIWLDPGSSGELIFKKVTGATRIEMLETWCTGEQLLDIYTQELELNIEAIKKAYPNTADWEDSDTRLFALMDVMYAGEGNFKIGTIDDGLIAGRELTKEDFLSNCTTENPFFNQNKKTFTRRRLCDWYMYSEGKFGYSVNDAPETDDIKQRYEFKSETPFQDLMVDKEGAEVVDM